MPQDVSNPLKLKLVMLFNVRNQTYCVCSHNLSAEEASQELEKLRRDGLPAFTVGQRSRHKAEEAEGCSDMSYREIAEVTGMPPGHGNVKAIAST